MRAAHYAALLTALPLVAHGATTTLTTPFDIAGDLAAGTEMNIGVPLPAFVTSSPVLDTVNASLTWGETFATIPAPGYPFETVLGFASLSVFDSSGNYVAAGECAATKFADSPAYDNYSPCAPTSIVQVSSTYDVGETDTFSFNFPDDPSLYADPSTPRTLYFSISAFAVCQGCLIENIDDAGGELSGTITTAFDPATVPEPSGLVLGVGILGILAARMGTTRRR